MKNEVFKVKLISSTDCFLHFSSSRLYQLSTKFNQLPSVVKLSNDNGNTEMYFTWSPTPRPELTDNSTVGISNVYAKYLNIKENNMIVLTILENAPVVKTVSVCALTQDDFDIIEVSQNVLQTLILDQVRVVSVNQPVTIWFSKVLYCTFHVTSMDMSNKIGLIDRLTDIVVSPVPRNALENSPETNMNLERSTHEISPNHLNYPKKQNSNDLNTDNVNYGVQLNRIFREKYAFHSGEIFRIYLLDSFLNSGDCCENLHVGIQNPYNAFVNKETYSTFLNRNLKEFSSAVVCSLSIINRLKNDQDKKSVYIRVYPIQEMCVCLKTSFKDGLIISNTVKDFLSLKLGDKVNLKMYTPPLNSYLEGLNVQLAKNLTEEDVENWFYNDLIRSSNVLMNNNCPMPIVTFTGNIEYVTVLFFPCDIACWPFSYTDFKTCKLYINFPEDQDEELVENGKAVDKTKNKNVKVNDEFDDAEVKCTKPHIISTTNLKTSFRFLEKLFKECLITLNMSLNPTSHHTLPQMRCFSNEVRGNVLCVGSGCCILMNMICNHLLKPENQVYIVQIDCKSFKGKKYENVLKKLIDELHQCVYYQPSLMILLDIDEMTGPANPEHEFEEMYFQSLWKILSNTILKYQSDQRIACLATAESDNDLKMLGPRGTNLFSNILQIPNLSMNDRIDVMKNLLADYFNTSSNVDLKEFAEKTEGYSFKDLSILSEKAIFKAWQRKAKGKKSDESPSVTFDDLISSIKSYTPSHLQSINLYKNTENSWKSVGGLDSIKKKLTEVIIWPTKFHNVYKQCPLNRESGVLLYGMPGTGKTLLASSLAGEAGLNFISIKGPELLSKYIGASEESVRNVFERARKAKPCILFFDEFDSLAPRRGHDSSGVMDRVVNQLLTQMDGVEERSGVYLVAATTRPDLIDPALLRPGRIGHVILCSLPNKNDRCEILKVLCKKLDLANDVNFSLIADTTEGFSGADLQGVVYAAQMNAYEDLINKKKSVEENSSENVDYIEKPAIRANITVNSAHILEALKDTEPSLKAAELSNYKKIYDSFQKNGNKFNPPDAQKVTLA